MVDESNVGGLLSILPNRKRFFWSPDYSDDIRYLQSFDSNNSDKKSLFVTFLRQYPSFEEISDPTVKAKTLSGIISEFQFSQQYQSYIEEQGENLSPANYTKLKNYVGNLRDTTFEAKMARAEAFVTSDLGRQWDDTKEKSNIGRFGNLWHATAGRHIAAPAHRLLKPFQLRFKAFGDTSSQKAKFFGLVLGTALAGVAAVGLLTVALPAAIAAGTLAAVATGLAAAGCGTLTAFFASKAPQAIRDLQKANAVARAERINSQKEFEAKNDMYRDGPELSKNSNDSVIAIHGITESDFRGNALLDVKNGNVLLPESMHLKYGGCATLQFDRIKNQLLITLNNIDGLTPTQNAEMIREIAEACTGKSVTQATVLGQSCESLEAMTKVLKENAETVLLNNRLANLEKGLTPEILSKIVAEALVTPIPTGTAEKGCAPFAGIAAAVMEVSSRNQLDVYNGFIERATPKLKEAISHLTGGKINDLNAGNIGQITNAIMASSVENYPKLNDAEKKLALVRVLANSTDPATVTAAAIEASRLGITKETFANIKDRAVVWAKGDPQDEKSNISNFTKNILRDLEITPTSLGRTDLQENLKTLHASAEEILTSTFSGSDKIEVGAWTLIKETQTAAARA